MRELLLDEIRMDGGTQSRERIDEVTVNEYAEDMKKPGSWSPVTVYHDGKDYWLADGFHRVLAAQRAGKRTIRGDIKNGTQTDAIWHACGVNSSHGLRRKNEDKRKSVKMALSVHSDKSDRFIAEHCKVGDQLVATVRREMTHQLRDHAVETRTGIDGKARKIPPPPSAPRAQPPPPSGDTRTTPPPPSGQAAVGGKQGAAPSPQPSPLKGEGEKRTPPPHPEVRLDGVKKPIPDHLVPLFDRGSEVQALLSQITSIKGVLKKARETDDPLFGECHFQAAEAALQTAYTEIKATKPFAVCPWCGGTLSNECRGCGQRGVVGEFRWSQHVPEEFKK